MTQKIVSLAPKHAATTEDALAVLDSLKKCIEDGEIVGFACVGIEPDDVTRTWMATTRPVTNLRMIGAVYHMLHWFEQEM